MGDGKEGDQMGLRMRQKVYVLCSNLWEVCMILSKKFLGGPKELNILQPYYRIGVLVNSFVLHWDHLMEF